MALENRFNDIFLHTYVTVRCRYVYSLAIRLENTQPEK